MNMTLPIKDKKQLELMKACLKSRNARDYLLFMTGISSALRVSDILLLKVSDIWDGKKPCEYIEIREKKTNKYKRFAISQNLKKAITDYMKESQLSTNDFVFQSREGENKAITRQMVNYILDNACEAVGVKERFGTHGMRKTFAYWAWKSGCSLALLMDILNHSSESMVKKYLGITQENLDKVYINLNL